MPLVFASNIYVDPATTPEWLQAFIGVNPVAHLVTAIRGLMAGAPNLYDIALALVGPVIVTAIFGPLAMRLYSRRI